MTSSEAESVRPYLAAHHQLQQEAATGGPAKAALALPSGTGPAGGGAGLAALDGGGAAGVGRSAALSQAVRRKTLPPSAFPAQDTASFCVSCTRQCLLLRFPPWSL